MTIVALPAAPPLSTPAPTPPPATGTMPYALINGAPYTIIDSPPLSIPTAVGQRTTCTFTVLDLPGTLAFRQNQSVQVFDEVQLCFSGFIESAIATKPGWGGTLEWAITCKDNMWLADKRVANVAYSTQTCLFMVQDLVTNYLAIEGVTLVSTQTGPTLNGGKTYPYVQVSKILDDLATLANFIWWIDEQKRLFFQPATTTPAPWVLDGSQIDQYLQPPSVENNSGLYRNSQWLTNIPDVTTSQTETRHGDGTTQAFTMSYPLHSTPTITVNAVAKTVGIQGVTPTGTKDWYWNEHNNVINQDPAATKLVLADTLSVTYIGEWLSTVYVQDAAQVTIEQSLEGGGTGIVEEATHDATLVTTTQGFQAASAMINKYSKQGNNFSFRTNKAGLVRGQALTVNLPPPFGPFANGVYLVEAVTWTRLLDRWWFDVKATIGPANVSWVQYFLKLSTPVIIDTSGSGLNQMLNILQSGTANYTWAIASAGSALPVTHSFPDNTLFPSNTLFPGTAGTAVAITWVKPNVGLDAVAAALGGNGAMPTVKYLAWGTGAQGTPQTATQLAAEVGRKALTSAVAGAAHGEEVINGIIGPQDSAGTTLGEVAFFGGASATTTANSGVLVAYGLYSHAHTASESVQIQADSTFS